MTEIALVTFCMSALLYSAAQLGHHISTKKEQKHGKH